MAIAQRFKLQGLLGQQDELEVKSVNVDVINPYNPSTSPQKENITDFKQKSNCDTEEVAISTKNEAIKIPMTEEEKESLLEKVDQHLVRDEDGSWRCLLCGKSVNGRSSRQQLRNHVEGRHLEGISIPCNLCGKTFRSRNSLKNHLSIYHK